MIKTFALKFGSIVLPDGVQGSKAKLSICFSPRLYADATPDEVGVPDDSVYGEKLCEQLEVLLTEKEGRLQHLELQIDERTNLPLALCADWKRQWLNQRLVNQRRTVWARIAPTGMPLHTWPRVNIGSKQVYERAATPEQAFQASRTNLTTVESVTLRRLEEKICADYGRILKSSLVQSGEDMSIFSGIAKGFEFALDRLTTFGGIDSTAHTTEPLAAGQIAANTERLREGDQRDQFHGLMTHLEEFPKFSRFLGLIVDVEFDVASLTQDGGEMRLKLDFKAKHVSAGDDLPVAAIFCPKYEPWAQFSAKFGSDYSAAQPGIYSLSADKFKLIQIDAIGLGLQSLRALQSGYAPKGQPPTLRSGGISLVKGNSSGKSEGIDETVDSLNQDRPDVLTGEHLSRGFVVDVGMAFPNGIAWQSICARTGAVQVGADLLFAQPAHGLPKIFKSDNPAELNHLAEADYAREDAAVVTIPAEAPQPMTGVLLAWDQIALEGVLATPLGDVRFLIPAWILKPDENRDFPSDVGRVYSLVGSLHKNSDGAGRSDIYLQCLGWTRKGDGAFGQLRKLKFKNEILQVTFAKKRSVFLQSPTDAEERILPFDAQTIANGLLPLSELGGEESVTATGSLDFIPTKIEAHRPFIGRIADIRNVGDDGSATINVVDELGQTELSLDSGTTVTVDGDHQKKPADLHIGSWIRMTYPGGRPQIMHLGVRAELRIVAKADKVIKVRMTQTGSEVLIANSDLELRLPIVDSTDDPKQSGRNAEIVLRDFSSIVDDLDLGELVDGDGFFNRATAGPIFVRLNKRGAKDHALWRVNAISEDERWLRLGPIVKDGPGPEKIVNYSKAVGVSSSGRLAPPIGLLVWAALKGDSLTNFELLNSDASAPTKLWARSHRNHDGTWRLVTPRGQIEVRTGNYQPGGIVHLSISPDGKIDDLQALTLATIQGFQSNQSIARPLQSGLDVMALYQSEKDLFGGELVVALKSKSNSIAAAALMARVEAVRIPESGYGFADLTLLGYRAEDPANQSPGSSILAEGQMPGGTSRRLRLSKDSAQALATLQRTGHNEKPIIQFTGREALSIESSSDLLVRTLKTKAGEAPDQFTGQWLDKGTSPFLRLFFSACPTGSTMPAGSSCEQIYFDVYVPKFNAPKSQSPQVFKDYRIAEEISPGVGIPGKTWEVDESQRQVFVSQSVFTWNGENLAVSPLYDALNVEAKTGQITSQSQEDINRSRATDQCVTLFPNYHAPNESMYPQIFGFTYYLRLRSLNMAGKSPRIDGPAIRREDHGQHGILSIKYLRYDPIAAPKVLRASSANRVEIPPDDAPPQTAANDHEQSQTQSIHYLRSVFKEGSERLSLEEEEILFFVLPGSTSYETARAHGLLFPGLGPMKDEDAIYSYLERVDQDAESGFSYNWANGQLPYIPDPLASNVAFELIVSPSYEGGATRRAEKIVLPFGSRWPNARAIRARFRAVASGVTRVKVHRRDVTISVAPGDVVTLRCASTPNARQLSVLGVREIIAGADRDALDDQIKNGRNSFVASATEITVAHAVNRPLGVPVITRLELAGKDRLPSDTFVKLICETRIAPKTTGAVTVEAQWDDYSDDPSQILPRIPLEEARRYFDPLIEGMPPLEMEKLFNLMEAWQAHPSPEKPKLFDFFSRELPGFIKRLKISPDALMEALKVFATVGPKRDVARHAIVPRSRPPEVASPKFRADFMHQLGSAKRLNIRYKPIAATSFADAFAKEVPKLKTEGSDAPSFVARATKPPVNPEVAKILPVYGWKDDELFTGARLERIRKGNALRIYFRRGWFSSGAEEKVALLFEEPGEPLAPDVRDLLVTQTGFDPVWVHKGSNQAGFTELQPADCELKVDVRVLRAFVTDPAKPRSQQSHFAVNAAIHEVRYSPSKGLWYCDIAFKSIPSYLPFARLALARYQPEAIDNCELSGAVITPFTQLHPERKLTLSPDWKVKLEGVFAPGPGTTNGQRTGRPHPIVTATLEPKEWRNRDFIHQGAGEPRVLNWSEQSGCFERILDVDRSKYGSILITEEALYPAESPNGKELNCERAIIYADRILLS